MQRTKICFIGFFPDYEHYFFKSLNSEEFDVRIFNPLDKTSNINWFKICVKDYGCKLYRTFINLNKDIRSDTLISESYNFTKEHDKFSSGVIEKEFANNKDKVYGYLFDIKGSQVASPYQFYVTDSSKYFLRGALYFDYKANNDSLSPIINRIKTDIDYMISTLKWK